MCELRLLQEQKQRSLEAVPGWRRGGRELRGQHDNHDCEDGDVGHEDHEDGKLEEAVKGCLCLCLTLE